MFSKRAGFAIDQGLEVKIVEVQFACPDKFFDLFVCKNARTKFPAWLQRWEEKEKSRYRVNWFQMIDSFSQCRPCKKAAFFYLKTPSMPADDLFKFWRFNPDCPGHFLGVILSSLLRPAAGVSHPDSVLAKVGKLPAKKALRWQDGSILSNFRKFQGCVLWFFCSTRAKCAENTRFPSASKQVCDLKIAVLFVLACSWYPSAKNGFSEFQISKRKLAKYLNKSCITQHVVAQGGYASEVVRNGGYIQNGRNLGDPPTVRTLRGNFSTQCSLPHQAKHFFLGFLFVLQANKSIIPTKIFLARHPLLVTMLIFAFTGLNDRKKVWENLNGNDLGLPTICDGQAESDAGISERPNWFRCMGWHYTRQGPSGFSTFRKTSFSSVLIVERWRAEHQLQFPIPRAIVPFTVAS